MPANFSRGRSSGRLRVGVLPFITCTLVASRPFLLSSAVLLVADTGLPGCDKPEKADSHGHENGYVESQADAAAEGAGSGKG